MAPDNVAAAAAKRVVKRTKVVEQKVVEVFLPGSKEELMEITEELSRVTGSVPIIEKQAQQEQEVVQNEAHEEHKEEEVGQNQAPPQMEAKSCVEAQSLMVEQETNSPNEAHEQQQEAKSMEAQYQAQEEQEKALAAHQQGERVKISEGAQTQAQEEPEKEKNMEAQDDAEKQQGQETAQKSKLDKIANPLREEPKKRAREDEEAQDKAQENIPTPPREEGGAQPKKRPRKALEKTEGGERRKRKRRSKKVEEEPGKQDYRRYLRRVMKTIEPDMRISSRAITVINSFLNDVFEKLVEEATKLSVQTGKKTLASKEIQGAVRFVLPGDLAKHAFAEGNKAWANYLRFKRKPLNKRPPTYIY
ncbi:hypothetical protein Cgig2_026464 [Carnegiea gigantea]|uniref:Core Histone H2A/H2B/H3 domain-containing protein n=1 Tax=Carnegiea gigantea TaxID=171969 RepID=A0A9Q1GQN0_9CARY|nr:hypothetical protein Cgig2_026464 [Carnegiea gigantea]